jgi:hypothetical protein
MAKLMIDGCQTKAGLNQTGSAISQGTAVAKSESTPLVTVVTGGGTAPVAACDGVSYNDVPATTNSKVDICFRPGEIVPILLGETVAVKSIVTPTTAGKWIAQTDGEIGYAKILRGGDDGDTVEALWLGPVIWATS